MNAEAKRGPAPALVWVKSSYSGAEGGQCVEVATLPARVHVRDSKDTTRAALAVDPTAWTAFVEFAAL
ncbi:DUF397 domain-containing protein [Streptomyces sp. NBC_01314]|uniref:DUF397 domain-containing protein n=1 Tax=Streptomyces sp. NBC_01314 TaxID=2903821 RepID=UPI0030859ECE|nr:DUF397 domain-containing protein [Streptomyces sp. NBC_01314]